MRQSRSADREATMDVYVVTGTSRGLGAGIVQELEGCGAQVVTIARHGATISADLGDAEGIVRACEALQERLSRSAWAKAVLINNAGVVEPVGPWGTLDAAALVRHSNVNLAAPMALTDAFLRATPGTPVRRVVHISSGAGRRAIAGWGAYCATKAGLDMAARTLAAEDRAGVEVVSLAPGVIDTDMQATVRGKPVEVFGDVERFRAMKADGTLRAARDVARDILAAESSGTLFAQPVGDLRTLAGPLR
jgi:NAD(P)-dependent dehydrogenase (short-subunit alcohol dehydrogenase family)